MGAAHESQVYVWDPFVRLFHWVLVVAFTVAFLTEETRLTSRVGGLCGGPLSSRVWSGFFKPPRALLDFVYPPAASISYIGDLFASGQHATSDTAPLEEQW